MALLLADSFDTYSTSQAAQRGWSGTGDIVTGGRWGNCMRCSNQYPIYSFTPGSASGGVGFAHQRETGVSTGYLFFTITQGGTEQLNIYCAGGSGVPYVARGSTWLASGTTPVRYQAWDYWELKFTIHNTNGVIELRRNGVPEISLRSGLNTQNTGYAWWDAIKLGSFPYTANRYDDIYVVDSTGPFPTNDLLGDVRIQPIYPSGDGNSSDFYGSDGNQVNNYALVDEAPPSTSDYVKSGVTGDKDTYTYGNVSATDGTVYAVQVLPYAAKTDAGSRNFATVARLDGTEEDSAAKALSTSVGYYPDFRVTKPGGGAWTIDDVNNAEFGIKVT
jgi:hypothetical protein